MYVKPELLGTMPPEEMVIYSHFVIALWKDLLSFKTNQRHLLLVKYVLCPDC